MLFSPYVILCVARAEAAAATGKDARRRGGAGVVSSAAKSGDSVAAEAEEEARQDAGAKAEERQVRSEARREACHYRESRHHCSVVHEFF